MIRRGPARAKEAGGTACPTTAGLFARFVGQAFSQARVGSGGGYLENHVTEKLVPSLDNPDGTASLVPPLVAIVISSMLDDGKVPMAPLLELSIGKFVPIAQVLSSPRSTVPKSARGRIPPPAVQQGASAIHSADDRARPETVALLVKTLPVVTSSMEMVNFEPL